MSFGDVEPSMISLRTEVMMRTKYFECYAKQYQRKGILVKIHLNTGKYRLVIWNSHVDGQVSANLKYLSIIALLILLWNLQ